MVQRRVAVNHLSCDHRDALPMSESAASSLVLYGRRPVIWNRSSARSIVSPNKKSAHGLLGYVAPSLRNRL
jgi:hypothetical protein